MNGPLFVALDADANIYVSNFAGSAVTVYAAGASGDVPPTRTVHGGKTGLRYPWGIALDSGDRIFVTNPDPYGSDNGPGRVLVSAAGLNGDIRPTQVIRGKKLKFPADVAVDASDAVYVPAGNNEVLRYAADSSGSFKVTGVLHGSNTAINGALGIAVR
jgi:hypothetical protein